MIRRLNITFLSETIGSNYVPADKRPPDQQGWTGPNYNITWRRHSFRQPALYQSVATLKATSQHLSSCLQANDWRYFVPADSGQKSAGHHNKQQFSTKFSAQPVAKESRDMSWNVVLFNRFVRSGS
jgi:hypothetical protein